MSATSCSLGKYVGEGFVPGLTFDPSHRNNPSPLEVWADAQFMSTVDQLNTFAIHHRVKIHVTSSWRKWPKTGRSNHKAGHALDFALLVGSTICGGQYGRTDGCLYRVGNGLSYPSLTFDQYNRVRGFLSAVERDTGMRWGGSRKGKLINGRWCPSIGGGNDPVHIDDCVNIVNDAKWEERVKATQEGFRKGCHLTNEVKGANLALYLDSRFRSQTLLSESIGQTAGRRLRSRSVGGNYRFLEGCIPTPFWVTICFSGDLWYQAGITVHKSKTSIGMTPYARAGFSIYASVRLWVVEAGAFASGTIVDASAPFAARVQFPQLQLCVRINVHLRAFSWRTGLFARWWKCRFYCRSCGKLCFYCSLRCGWGAPRTCCTRTSAGWSRSWPLVNFCAQP